MLLKVISGGQYGVDYIGLQVAKARGIPTGGTAPKKWKVEGGFNPQLSTFGLVESKDLGYVSRTKQNVRDSDGTVLFGDMSSAGSALTLVFCKNYVKPYKINPSSEELANWIKDMKINTLNIAGNRASKLTTHQKDSIADVLEGAFRLLGY